MLYSSWLYTKRMGWVTKSKPKGCIFCRIAKGDKRVPSRILYRGKKTMVIMNLFPYNTGHLEVIPIRHVKDLSELTEEELQDLWRRIVKSMRLLRRVLKPQGFNVGINIGELAGASVEHLHVHIVPRFRRDFGFMEVTGETRVMPESIDETFDKLKQHVKLLED